MHRLLIPTLILLAGCDTLHRSNPFDPVDTPESDAELSLYLPLNKALVTVIHRVEAVLESPNGPPIVKELEISPLGPATGMISILQPGEGFNLTLRGYDLNDELIFEGQKLNITISTNDTTLVEFELTLLKPLSDIEDNEEEIADPVDDTDGADTGSTPEAPDEDVEGTTDDENSGESSEATTGETDAGEPSTDDTDTGEVSTEETDTVDNTPTGETGSDETPVDTSGDTATDDENTDEATVAGEAG